MKDAGHQDQSLAMKKFQTIFVAEEIHRIMKTKHPTDFRYGERSSRASKCLIKISFIDRIYCYLLINSRSQNITSDSQLYESDSPIFLAICELILPFSLLKDALTFLLSVKILILNIMRLLNDCRWVINEVLGRFT